MSIIKVETPDGIVDVEIEGEEPNQDEQQAIFNTFFSDQGSPIKKGAGKLDFATYWLRSIPSIKTFVPIHSSGKYSKWSIHCGTGERPTN